MTAASILGVVLIVASVAAIPAGQPPGVVFLLFVPDELAVRGL